MIRFLNKGLQAYYKNFTQDERSKFMFSMLSFVLALLANAFRPFPAEWHPQIMLTLICTGMFFLACGTLKQVYRTSN